MTSPHPVPSEGRWPSSQTRDRSRWTLGTRDERADAYGEIDWVRRPDAGVKLARSESFALAMVSQKAGSPGRSRISRKAIAQGRPGVLRCSCMLMCTFLFADTHMRP